MAGLEFNPEVIGPTLVLGMAAAGLYGLLATALVMTYRVSRTIGFVHGGLALLGTYAYWWLTYPEDGAAHARMGRLPGMLVVVAAGAVIGVAYGSTVTGRLANWPRVRLTIYSLGWLLGLAFATSAVFVNNVVGVQGLPIPSLFGTSTYTVFGAVVTIHQVATVAILVALIAVLSVLLLRTRTGTYIRAIADDPEAGRWVGIPLHWVGTGVFGLSGAVSTFAGVLLASTVGINFFLIPVVFLRALTVSVLGGFTSLPLALVGCLVLGVGEASLGADLFGTRSPGEREIIVMAVLFGLVFLINRYRRVRVIEVTGM